MAIQTETELYKPIKAFLEARGYEVKSEIHSCDIVAVHKDETEPTIVELKKTFNLSLLFQGIDRLKISDQVYFAVEKTRKKSGAQNQRWGDITKLCKMLGIGLLTVQFYQTKKPFVEVLNEPAPFIPRNSVKRVKRVLTEFHERSGDYNEGGSTKRKLITVYRERALHCAHFIQLHEKLSPRQLKLLTGNANVSHILQKNYYGWFLRLERGVYTLSAAGEEALQTYAHVIEGQNANQQPTATLN